MRSTKPCKATLGNVGISKSVKLEGDTQINRSSISTRQIAARERAFRSRFSADKATLSKHFAELGARGIKPRIVILTAKGGHVSATRDVANSISELCADATISEKYIDDFVAPWKRAVGGLLFDWAFTHLFHGRIGAWLNNRRFARYDARIGKIGSAEDLPCVKHFSKEDMLRYFNAVRPTHIISTIWSCTEALAALGEAGAIPDCSLAQILTDSVGTHRYARLAQSLDMTFAPNSRTASKLVERGASRSNIRVAGHPSGWPSAMAVDARPSSSSARVPIILMSGGTWAMGNYPKFIQSIADEARVTGTPARIVAIVSDVERRRLRTLRTTLRSHRRRDGTTYEGETVKRLPGIEIAILPPQTRERHLALMKGSDMFVGKPGGSTSAEVIHAQIPAVFVDLVGAQEGHNAEQLSADGLALVTRDQKHVGKPVVQLLESEALRSEMRIRQRDAATKIDPLAIAKWIASTLESAAGGTANGR